MYLSLVTNCFEGVLPIKSTNFFNPFKWVNSDCWGLFSKGANSNPNFDCREL